MKLLIGGSKSKIFHLKEFGEALSNFGIEYKLVNDVEIYSGFPSKKIPGNFQTLSKFNKLIDELKPDAVFYDNQLHFGLAVLKSKIPLFMHLRGDYWSEMKWARETIYKMPHQRFAAWWKMSIAEKLAKKVWTPDVVVTCIERGLHEPLRCFLLFVVIWTTIGLIVSSAFFSDSLSAFLPFFLLGIFTGLLLPAFQ